MEWKNVIVCWVGKDGYGSDVDTADLWWNSGEGGRWRGEPVNHGLVKLEIRVVGSLTVDRIGLRSIVSVELSKSIEQCIML